MDLPAKIGLQNIGRVINRMKVRLDDAETSAKVLEIRAEAKSVLHLAKLINATDTIKSDCLRVVMFAEVGALKGMVEGGPFPDIK